MLVSWNKNPYKDFTALPDKALIGNVGELEHETIDFTALPDKALFGNVGELKHDSMDFTVLSDKALIGNVGELVTCWERADPLAVVFGVFCHFPKCVLVHIRIKGGVGAVKLV